MRKAQAPVRVVLLDLSFNSDLDIQAVDILRALSEELHENGMALWIANVHELVRKMIERSELNQPLGLHVYRNIEEGVSEYLRTTSDIAP